MKAAVAGIKLNPIISFLFFSDNLKLNIKIATYKNRSEKKRVAGSQPEICQLSESALNSAGFKHND